MSEKSFPDDAEVPENVAIESKLPLTAIDIESQKDMESGRYHKIQSLHKWFAPRPTPAARLAILASVYPGEIDPDHLLRLMQIGPKSVRSGIGDYVQNKFATTRRSGTLDEHYDYPNPNTQSPTEAQVEDLRSTLAEGWGGSVPTILDPTAGRGVIPFEAIRYGIPAKANELNPVAALINRVVLEYAPEVGSIAPDIYDWRDKIHQRAKKNIEPYYPTKKSENVIQNSVCTYLIECESCAGDIPLTRNWWLNKDTEGGDAVRPKYENGDVSYEHVEITGSDDEYDPSNGPLHRGSAECPHCGVLTESDTIRERIKNDQFEYSIYGVSYSDATGDQRFRAGSELDDTGMEKARERIESDFDLLTFLSEPIEASSRINDPRNYGMEEWRDIFTPRQLVVHYEYLQAFRHFVPEIQAEYDDQMSDAILTVLTFVTSRAVDLNTRLTQWYANKGTGSRMFAENNYALKRMFVDNNLAAPRRGFIKASEHVIESYESLASYNTYAKAEHTSQDAATLSEQWENNSIDVAVVDPPYYGSIHYAELSDIFYVIQKQYLQDIYPDIFSEKLSNKDDEAIANPARFDGLATGEHSQKELADEYYEDKMEDIFGEIRELLTEGGVMTVMFTHRDMDAWDTLTSALIKAGFTITATHPIKTEMSDRISMRGNASADSSILLVGRKAADNETESAPTLWEDIQADIHDVAEQEAKSILDSGFNISKTDTAISAYGPTLQKYAQEHPVVNKKGEEIRPREALSQARKAVTGVLAERFLKTDGLEQIDSLSRWYILSWLIYENDIIPYDEARQLGVAANVDIDDIKRQTKIWGKSGKDIELKDHSDRVQDIVMLKSDSADDPSSRKYPVNPTNTRFTYDIDAVFAAIHIYDREGARAAWQWLSERNMKSNRGFKTTITALLEVLPSDSGMRETLVNLVSGETGDYLDINLDHIDMSGKARQTEIGDHQ